MSTMNPHMPCFARSCRAVAAFAVVSCVSAVAAAQGRQAYDPLSFQPPDVSEQFEAVSIEQNLGATVPLDSAFVDESGARVTLRELMDGKPAILALVYYQCPMLCNQMLNGVESVIGAIDYAPGKDYHALAISIDPTETPELAKQKKAAHLEHMGRTGAADGWHFLTGEETAIEAVADTVGFRYVRDVKTGQFAHAAGIMVLTPDGTVARYYYGIEYIPRDVEFGLIDASKGKVGTLVDKLVLLCYAYDPATGTYGFWIFGAMRIFAALMIVGFLVFWGTHYLQWRRKVRREQGVEPYTSGDPQVHHNHSNG